MLVNSVAYQDGRKLADIDPREVHDYTSRPGCFVWVALRDPDAAELADMQSAFDLHALAVEDAHHGHQRPKIEEYGSSLFLVMHTVDVTGDELQVGEVDVFVDHNYVVSVRAGTEKGFEGVRARCELEPELLRHGAGYVLYALMDAVVDRYFPALEAIEDEFDEIEDDMFAGKTPRQNIEALYYVRHKLTRLKHAVAPLVEATSRLYGGRVPQVCAGLGEYFRDVYDHLVRINSTIDSVRDTVATATSVNLALITVGESEVTKRLAAYAALVAVPTLIAGIYGMNFRHMPEL
ncbi:MAG: magnesium and cobalt transport protein CorA, partial [Betaproteobacteria bacterium]|nr:magnesium and cobalt transport protein CorA [Betaproteobacteria bacterium]